MKKMRNRIYMALMAGLLVCLPTLQALAQTYDVGVLDPAPVLFPGDTLTGIVTPVMQDDEPLDLGAETPATWTNEAKSKVYRAETGEDGSLQLTLAGYVMIITGGTSSAGDETTGPIGGHYSGTDDEDAEDDKPKKDRAYYPVDTLVNIKADEPEEGMEFDKWTVETDEVVLADDTSSETTLTMPKKKVKITANYRPVQAEPAEDPNAVSTPEEVIDPNAGNAPEEVIDPNAENVPEEVIDPSAENAPEEVVDPNAGNGQEIVIDPSAENAPEEVVDPNAGNGQEIVIDPSAENAPEEVVDPNAGNGQEIVIDPNAGNTPEEVADPSAENAPEEVVDPNAGNGQEIVIDPNAGNTPEEVADPNAENVPEEVVDPNAGNGQEIVIDPNMGNTPEEVVDSNMNAGDGQEGSADQGNGDNGTDSAFGQGDDQAINVTTSDEYGSDGENVQEYSLDVNYGSVVGEEADQEEGQEDGTNNYSYAAGSPVSVSANDYSSNGCSFSSWNVESQNVELIPTEDPATVSFIMPEDRVVLTAQYIDGDGVPVATPQNQQPVSEEQESTDPEAGDPTQSQQPVSEEQEPTPVPEAEDPTQSQQPVSEVQEPVPVQEVQEPTPAPEEQEPTPSPEVQEPTPSPEVQEQTPNPEVQEPTPSPEVQDPAQTPQTENPPVVPATYTLTVGEGTVMTGAGAVSTATYAEGADVVVTANDKTQAGFQFAGWTVSTGNVALSDSLAKTVAFKMPASDVTITAGYTEIPQTEPEPELTTVTVVNGIITSAGASSGAYSAGTVIQLQANAPSDGMKFVKWTAQAETGESVADSFFTSVQETMTGFTVPASNVTVMAEYEQVESEKAPTEYKIRINDGTADCKKAIGGTKVKITADEAPEGMEFDCWKTDSGNVTLKDAYKATTSFTMPTADVEVSAYYKMKEYHVTVQNGYADHDTCYMGQLVTVYSNYPASGREFAQWETVSGKVSFDDSSRWTTTFKMPADDVTVSAAYKDGPSPESNQIQELVAGGEYITDSTIRFTAAGAGMDNANPNPGDYRYRPTGYQIGNVTGSWQASPYTTSMSIKARGDYTLKVTYGKDVFDGTNWIPDGTSDTRSVTFRVVTPAEAVKTGDETPIAMMVILAGASCLLFLLLLSLFIRRKSRS